MNETKERPILFSAPMVRAILDGRKTQTRRVIKLPRWAQGSIELHDKSGMGQSAIDWPNAICKKTGCLTEIPCPYGWRGDRLWVREAFNIIDDPAAHHVDDGPRLKPVLGVPVYECKDAIRRGPDGERWVVDYAADENCRVMDKVGSRRWKPSIHMPRWASRITRQITGVTVERLNDISEADAIAEGLMEWTDPPRITTKHYGIGIADVWEKDPRTAYRRLWESIHGKDSWAANPFVWCVSFRRLP